MATVTDKQTEQLSDQEEVEEPEQDGEVQLGRFGIFTRSGTFVGTGDFHPDPVRILVENLAKDVSTTREELSDLSDEVAAIREELGKIGRLVVGLHEILVRMDKAE